MGKYSDLLEMVAEIYNVPYFGFLVGKHKPALEFGLLTRLLKLSPDAGTALLYGHQYVSLINPAVIWEINTKNGIATSIRMDRYPRFDKSEQLHSMSITQYYKLLQGLCGKSWKPMGVFFQHSITAAVRKKYEAYYDSPVLDKQDFYGIKFPAHYLSNPIATANAEQLNVVKRHLNTLVDDTTIEHGVSNQVRQHIRKRIGMHGCNLLTIAEIMAIHPKKLQRALKKENTSFKELLKEERHLIAEYYLKQSSIKLLHISDILGYNDVSAFSRAFYNTEGISPLEWRKRVFQLT